jgi:hypothetical protein
VKLLNYLGTLLAVLLGLDHPLNYNIASVIIK